MLITATGEDGKKVAKNFPHWVKKGKFSGALMYPPEDILAREDLGITLRDAWIIHGGNSDRICVESQYMYDFYIDEGIPPEKLALTGTLYCDIIYSSMSPGSPEKNSFLLPKKINNNETRILVSWPPSYHAERGSKCEFSSYSDLGKSVLKFIESMQGVKLTVSLHPNTPISEKNELENIGISLSDEYVIELIPHHDIFVTCFSSTIRWAVSAGKPVVNYDFYGFELLDYDNIPAVILVKTFEKFKETIKKLSTDSDYYKKIAFQQIESSTQYGVVDGKSFESIVGIMNSLTSTK